MSKAMTRKKTRNGTKSKKIIWHHCYATDGCHGHGQGNLAFVHGNLCENETVFYIDSKDDLDIIIEACEEARTILQEEAWLEGPEPEPR